MTDQIDTENPQLRIFREALQHHQEGRMSEADACYRQLLMSDPNNGTVFNLLGVLCCQTGRSREALHCFQRAVAVAPELAAARNNLGTMRLDSGDLVEAESDFSLAIRIDPTYAEAYYNLGCTLRQQLGYYCPSPEIVKSAQRLLLSLLCNLTPENRIGKSGDQSINVNF